MTKEFDIEFRTLIPRYGMHTITAKNKRDAIKQAKELLRQENFNTIFNIEVGGEDPVGGIYVSCEMEDMEFDVHVKD